MFKAGFQTSRKVDNPRLPTETKMGQEFRQQQPSGMAEPVTTKVDRWTNLGLAPPIMPEREEPVRDSSTNEQSLSWQPAV